MVTCCFTACYQKLMDKMKTKKFSQKRKWKTEQKQAAIRPKNQPPPSTYTHNFEIAFG